jgi:hypothetical protein
MGGCFVGKVETEQDALYHAQNMFTKCYEREQDGSKEPVTWHIVDMDLHSVIFAGNKDNYKDLRIKKEKKIPKDIAQRVITYTPEDITVEKKEKGDV